MAWLTSRVPRGSLPVLWVLCPAITAKIMKTSSQPSHFSLIDLLSMSAREAHCAVASPGAAAFECIGWLPGLKRQSLEYELRHAFDDRHDQKPERGRVEHVALLLDGLLDIQGDLLRRGPQRTLGKVRGHRGVDEAVFDGQHLHAALVQAVAQPLQEDGQCALGG